MTVQSGDMIGKYVGDYEEFHQNGMPAVTHAAPAPAAARKARRLIALS